MVKLLSMKKKLAFLEPIDDHCRKTIKKFKEKRTKILKQSLSKLKKIPDAEQCLRQAVLIRNTFIRAKDLSPKQYERQLLTRPVDDIIGGNDSQHADLIDDIHEQYDSNEEDGYNNNTTATDFQDYNQSCNSDCGSEMSVDSRQLVAVS